MKFRIFVIFKMLCLLSAMFLIACNFNKTYINREEDIKEGVDLIKRFYSAIEEGNSNKIDAFTSDSLKMLAGNKGISKIATFINTKTGHYKSFVVGDKYVVRTAGSRNETLYTFKLKVTYEKGVLDEVIGFKKYNNHTTLYSYHAYSDLLIH